MTAFLNLGKHIINIDQVVSVERLAPEPAGERYESYARAVVPFPAKPLSVVLTLTAIEEVDMSLDGTEYHDYAASKSQTITVAGELAKQVWAWFAYETPSFGALTDAQAPDQPHDHSTPA